MQLQAKSQDAKKPDEFSRVFASLPDVLIQHPGKGCAYFIPANILNGHRATPDTFANLRSGTVTFCISGTDLIDEVPPYNDEPGDSPDVLIRYLADRTAYFLSYDQLSKFKVEQPELPLSGEYVSFIVPGGMEFVEEIPLLKRGLLQSNTG
ncbi:hypothetical protein [Bradyrhizobium sp. Cp5.3]|uniref:hypothetical protein n=1 Tax=Bradyrhizobium sp. Cp5.3 TaxID=443598 RepID=UPI0004815CED|nr:hypothetical protein [Bradyrhizobium sp. Cp5.3]